jgi:hypothetical protein
MSPGEDLAPPGSRQWRHCRKTSTKPRNPPINFTRLRLQETWLFSCLNPELLPLSRRYTVHARSCTSRTGTLCSTTTYRPIDTVPGVVPRGRLVSKGQKGRPPPSTHIANWEWGRASGRQISLELAVILDDQFHSSSLLFPYLYL